MSVGLPGSGIGGIFYLLSALWMPFDFVIRTLQGRAPRNRAFAAQLVLALGIIAALFATGWAIDRALAFHDSPNGIVVAVTGISAAHHFALPKIFRAATFAITFGTLAAVLLSVQFLRLFCAPRPVVETQKAARKAVRKAA